MAKTKKIIMATPHAHLDLPDADYHRQEMLNKKAQLKGKRRVKITAGATSGAIVGGLILLPAFPLGMVLGGALLLGSYTICPSPLFEILISR
mmetsp:Transcript_15669/g.20860  ORF Transcript_15669/g.20860 Transcript_15669/m.20860 type:complete len:92 (+) Transcript_15669:14-289(+)